MASKIDIEGQRYGKLVALLESPEGNGKWEFRCDCGNVKAARKSDVRFGKVVSCGCHRNSIVIKRNKENTPRGGLSHSRIGSSWGAMMTRCYNKGNRNYAAYGAIGINVCEFLRSTPVNLILLIGDRPPGKTLDRINNFDSYHCGQCAECLDKNWALNVRWATPTQQGRNQRTNRLLEINGETHCVTEWAEISGIPQSAIRDRLRGGKTGAALIAPLKK